MEELVKWARKAIDEDAMHPLLIIAVFNVVFLAIHPFQDGNGRLSRILITLMLLRAGYAYVPYASLEHIVEDSKDLYYKALRRTQIALKTASVDWEPWLRFFLRCLKQQKSNLELKIEDKKTKYDVSQSFQSGLHPQAAFLAKRLFARSFQPVGHFFWQKCRHISISPKHSLRGFFSSVKGTIEMLYLRYAISGVGILRLRNTCSISG